MPSNGWSDTTFQSLFWLQRRVVVVNIAEGTGERPTQDCSSRSLQRPEETFLHTQKLIEAKAQRTLGTIQWLEAHYDKSKKKAIDLQSEMQRLEESANLRNLLMVEGRIPDVCWRYFQKILPNNLGFVSRIRESHQRNASDQVNCLLNYGYSGIQVSQSPE